MRVSGGEALIVYLFIMYWFCTVMRVAGGEVLIAMLPMYLFIMYWFFTVIKYASIRCSTCSIPSVPYILLHTCSHSDSLPAYHPKV